jgi:hypothetical protein
MMLVGTMDPGWILEKKSGDVLAFLNLDSAGWTSHGANDWVMEPCDGSCHLVNYGHEKALDQLYALITGSDWSAKENEIGIAR